MTANVPVQTGRVQRPTRLVHTSDVHLFAARPFDEDLAMVRSLAATAVALGADVLAIVGDLFDHNRVPRGPADALMAALAEPAIPVIVLPGNHDPLTPGSIYRHIERPPNLLVLGLDTDSIDVAGGWSVTGRAHLDYANFSPLDFDEAMELTASAVPVGRPGPQTSKRIVLAHGHYDLRGEARAVHRPGWLITDEDLDRTAASYVGLGHWDRAFMVRPAGPPAYYSGSPWLAETVNVVDLVPGQEARVERAPLQGGSGTG